jgi:integrase/recombinase XerD
MWDVLDQAVLKAGLVKRLSPHKLRHACATHMLEGGADVRLLQEFLGHESLNTTQIYTQVTLTRLREVYERTHPRGSYNSSGGGTGQEP